MSTAPPSPPVPRAELATTSEPEPLLQVSSEAGVSLADFKDPLEMSRHNTYF